MLIQPEQSGHTESVYMSGVKTNMEIKCTTNERLYVEGKQVRDTSRKYRDSKEGLLELARAFAKGDATSHDANDVIHESYVVLDDHAALPSGRRKIRKIRNQHTARSQVAVPGH
jgi:hypothetical protein